MPASPQRPNLPGPGLWLWRHPRPIGAAGRCIGQTDLPVPARRAKRLAHRIRHTARRESLPWVVWTSPLRRCADVGRWLARWGWAHHIDARLLELDFGHWDGQHWANIALAEVAGVAGVAMWEADFAQHAPGGRESLATLAARCQTFIAERAGHRQPLLLVSHAGWINASAVADASRLAATDWPAAPVYGSLTRRPAAP